MRKNRHNTRWGNILDIKIWHCVCVCKNIMVLFNVDSNYNESNFRVNLKHPRRGGIWVSRVQGKIE